MSSFNQVLEAELRNLSAESRKSESLAGQLAGWLVNSEHPEIKVASERAILKIRSLSEKDSTTTISIEDNKVNFNKYFIKYTKKNFK